MHGNRQVSPHFCPFNNLRRANILHDFDLNNMKYIRIKVILLTITLCFSFYKFKFHYIYHHKSTPNTA